MKKKILFLITKSNFGGAQRYVLDVASNLPKDQFAVSVALGGDGVLIEKLEAAGIRVIRIPSLERDISLKKELLSFWSIAKIIRTEKPDILHVNSSKAGGIGAFWGRLFRVPRVLYTAHGWAFNEDRGALSRFIVGFFHWLTILFAHTTITVSDTLASQMHWLGTKRKMVTVYNGRTQPVYLTREAARTYFRAHEPRLDAHMGELWTGTIAELHPIKGHEVMLEAMAKLVAKGNQLRHLIIGDGELHKQLENKIEELELTEYVFLLGHHDEASQYLKAFDIYVQPSFSEALAYTIIEAAQAGLPIVASRVGGIPEILTNEKNGVLVAPQDPKSLAGSISDLIQDTEKRTNLAEAAEIRGTDFSLDRMLDATIALYLTHQ